METNIQKILLNHERLDLKEVVLIIYLWQTQAYFRTQQISMAHYYPHYVRKPPILCLCFPFQAINCKCYLVKEWLIARHCCLHRKIEKQFS